MNRFEKTLEHWLDPEYDAQPQYIEAITEALKLAARLEHPSDDMLNALLKNTADHCVLDMHSNYMGMIEQLKKEVEDA